MPHPKHCPNQLHLMLHMAPISCQLCIIDVSGAPCCLKLGWASQDMVVVVNLSQHKTVKRSSATGTSQSAPYSISILELPLNKQDTSYKIHFVGSALHRPCIARLPSVLQRAMVCVNMCLVVTVAALLMPDNCH